MLTDGLHFTQFIACKQQPERGAAPRSVMPPQSDATLTSKVNATITPLRDQVQPTSKIKARPGSSGSRRSQHFQETPTTGRQLSQSEEAANPELASAAGSSALFSPCAFCIYMLGGWLTPRATRINPAVWVWNAKPALFARRYW